VSTRCSRAFSCPSTREFGTPDAARPPARPPPEHPCGWLEERDSVSARLPVFAGRRVRACGEEDPGRPHPAAVSRAARARERDDANARAARRRPCRAPRAVLGAESALVFSPHAAGRRIVGPSGRDRSHRHPDRPLQRAHRPQILREEVPLGRILRDAGIEYRSRPTAFFEVAPTPEIMGIFWMREPRALYGRQTEITVGGARIGNIVEILPLV